MDSRSLCTMSHAIRLLQTCLVCILIALAALSFNVSAVLAADTMPPSTDLILSGVKGNDNWYITSVDVNLRAFDLESSPASTTYQINSDPAQVEDFTTVDNAIINPSFEDGWVAGINNWQPYPSPDPNLYQASVSKLDFRSAAIQNSGNNYHYWTNYDNYVPVVAGRSYTVSAWMRAFNVQTAPGGWFEAWVRDTSGVQSDTKLAESMRVTGELDWTLESINFTIPAGYDGVYLKMGAQSGDSGIVWYDGVSMYTGAGAVTQFTMVQNGQNTLQYYSTDNQGNVEPIQVESPIKIDTAEPQDWNNFHWQESGNDHTYIAWVDVRDIASGVVPASAQFRWYDDANCNCWSAWLPVESVTRTDNGGPVPIGYTGYVTLQTPATDMGNSSIHTKPEMQFKINDVATSLATSPTYSLFGPWLKVTSNGDIYARGGIGGLGVLPAGEYTTHGVIAAGSSINNVQTFYNWLVSPYQHASPTSPMLSDLVPRYDKIRSKAVNLPANKLPSVAGVYSYPGNYTIDQNSITSAFTSSVFSAIIIIEGNLNINRNFNLNSGTAVAFLVTGNIIYSKDVTQSSGVFIAAGNINTNGSIDADSKDSTLTHKGSFVAGNNLIFGRDLGKNKNDADPAEIIEFPISYLVNPLFANLFSQQDANLKWQETE